MIVVLSIAISLLGALLVLILIARFKKLSETQKLAKHRSKDEGLADLLVYGALVDKGVIVGKNGSFMAAWRYQGADNSSSTALEREAVSEHLNRALNGLGGGWMLHVDAIRQPATTYPEPRDSAFPDTVCAALDEERRRLFERIGTMYEGQFVMTLTWFPPMLAQRKFVELMFDDDNQAPNRSARTQGLIDDFNRMIRSVESQLSSALKLHRLADFSFEQENGTAASYDEFLAWLQFCITGINQPVQLPDNPMYLDAVIGGKELWGGVIPKIGTKYIQTIAIDGFPLISTPGILTVLTELACEYRWSNRFIFMDSHEALSHLGKFRNKWSQKRRGFFDQIFQTGRGKVNHDAVSMVDDADVALAEIQSGEVKAGYYTSVVVLMSEDRRQLEAQALYVEKSINALGFVARIETINNMDAFMGSLPGHGTENVRRPIINTMNLADLLPTSTIWSGSPTAPCPFYPDESPALMHCVTHGATPFRLNLHVGDLGHTFIAGPTGAGKSTKLALIAAQLRRYRGMKVFAFDKGNSMFPLCAAINAATNGATGIHYDIGGDQDKLAFCPLQYLESENDRAWAMEWINGILLENNVITTPTQRIEISATIDLMYKNGAHTMSDFANRVQDHMMRDALQDYTIAGAMGRLMDAQSDSLSLADFTVFEIESLMNLSNRFSSPILSYLFRRIEIALDGSPAAIILDEAWIMLRSPMFRAKIREWLKVLRRANCIVIMATQNLTDAANSEIFDDIVQSTATKIFLPNPAAREESVAAIYRQMGLNATQIDQVAKAIKKRQYYYSSEMGNRLYELELGPLALAVLAVSDKESIQQIKAFRTTHGHGWLTAWLARSNINIDDYKIA